MTKMPLFGPNQFNSCHLIDLAMRNSILLNIRQRNQHSHGEDAFVWTKAVTKCLIAKSIMLSNFMAKSINQILPLPNQLNNYVGVGKIKRKNISYNL